MKPSIISAERVLPITRPLLKNGAMLISPGKILEIGTRAELKKKYPEAEERHHELLMPGLVNGHTHIELSGLPLLAPGKSFTDWLIQIIEQKRALDPARIEREARLALENALALGITSLGDIVSLPVIFGAHKQGKLFSTVFFELTGMRDEDVKNRVSLAKSVLGEHNFRLGNNQLGISLHAPYSASLALFEAARKTASERGLALCTHLAESRDETEFIMSGQGAIAARLYPLVGWSQLKPAPNLVSPARYLAPAIDQNLTLVHCVEISDDDLEIISRSRAVVHCPRSNLHLSGKLAPVPKMLRSGVKVALGTDSPASAGDSNLWNEMKKVLELRREYPGGEIAPSEILQMVTINGARAIFREHELGSIEPGKIANLLALKISSRSENLEELAGSIIASGPEQIGAVYLAGSRV